MEFAVRYCTRSGNTKKLAEAVAAVVGADARDVGEDLAEKTDLLFLGSSLYAGSYDASVRAFFDRNADKVGTVVCFGSSASGKSTHAKLNKLAAEKGFAVYPEFFNCPGHFLFLHKDRPNQSDLSAAARFAKAVCQAQKDR